MCPKPSVFAELKTTFQVNWSTIPMQIKTFVYGSMHTGMKLFAKIRGKQMNYRQGTRGCIS